jgi:hypothetical protein
MWEALARLDSRVSPIHVPGTPIEMGKRGLDGRSLRFGLVRRWWNRENPNASLHDERFSSDDAMLWL